MNKKRGCIVLTHPPDFRSEEADFESADLTGANLYATHLNNANLRGVHLDKAILFQTDMEGASLEGIHLEGTFINLNMKPFFKKRGVDLSKVKWIDDEKK